MGRQKKPAEPAFYHPIADGLGDPIDLNASYYVQDSRGYVGNCMSFWRTNGAGYACDLDDIGVFTGEQAAKMRETDIPWPVDFIQKNSVTHANIDRMRSAAILLGKVMPAHGRY